MPTSDHWMLTYETLDAVMKNTKNPDYYAMPSQANQHVLRKVLKDWKSHFELLASYRQNPGKFKAQPKQPGYIKTPYTTVTFTNKANVSVSAGTEEKLAKAAEYKANAKAVHKY